MKRLCAVLILSACLALFSSLSSAADAVVKNGSKVAFDFMLIVDGKIVDTSQARGPLEYTQGEGKLPPGLMKQMEGMKVKEEKTIELKPEEAYGYPDPTGVREIPLTAAPKDMKPAVGMMLQMQDQEGHLFPAKITEVKKDSIMIDLNHPLAGKILTFKVKIVSIK